MNRRIRLVLLGAVLTLGFGDTASALIRFDFEPMYFAHAGHQVWDFSLTRVGSTYHIFYHSIPESHPNAVYADTLWHASSPDLRHWQHDGPIATTLPDTWQAGALWAPDIFRDESSGLWILAFTGCDEQFVQRIGMLFSLDLYTWWEWGSNPNLEPDPDKYLWSPDRDWSDFRDPFVYREGGLWHMLVTAKQEIDDVNTGVVYHTTSLDLRNWFDVDPLFVHDGGEPWRVLESCQYHVIGQTHHLLFGEFDTPGVTLLSAAAPQDWTMADRQLLDYGYAPELDEFDPGIHIYSRLSPYFKPNGIELAYVVRLDTLLVSPEDASLAVHRPHPLDYEWESRSGTATLGNPVFGDNPLWRNESSVGLVGNAYFGSAEYYQGPLSNRGAPGTLLGDGVTGVVTSRAFNITGNRMRLLVGGGNYPATCYVALIDAVTDSILCRETGAGSDPMTLREWDLRPLQGRSCRITIVDAEAGPMGHINVDEIVEELAMPTSVSDVPGDRAPSTLVLLGAAPNPFNPVTELRFALDAPRMLEVAVYDLRGRRIWNSGPRPGVAGLNGVTWRGDLQDGRPAPAGSYVYRISTADGQTASGKISLVK